MNRILELLRGVMICAAVAVPLSSADAAEDFVLMTGNEYPPFADQDLPEGGMATDIVRTAFKRMGFAPDIVFRPWKRGMVEALNGDYLATFPWAHSDEREKGFHFTQQLYSFHQYFFTNATSEISGSTAEDLQGARLCLPIGYTTATLEDWMSEGVITLVRPPTMPACFQMLASDRADVIRVNDLIGWSTVDSLFDDRSDFRVVDGGPVRTSTQFAMFSRKHPLTPEIMPKFEVELEKMKSDGTLFAIMENHLK